MPGAGLLAVRGLVAVAVVIASYLAWHALAGGRPIGCGPESGCDKVLHSRWAYWFGVPVSLFSLVVYVLIFGATFGTRAGLPPARRTLAWQLLIACAVAVAGAALWFVALQAFVLHSFCRFCMVAHTCGAMAAGLILVAAPVRKALTQSSPSQTGSALPPALARKFAALGVAAVAILAVGQIVHQPKTFVVTSIPAGTHEVPAAGPTNPPLLALASRTSSPPPRVVGPITSPVPAGATSPQPFSFYDGRFSVDLNAVPVIGSPANPRAMISLFDYTCHHCRLMHKVLVEVQAQFSNAVVIASLPMPLDPKCNPTVMATRPDHTNACAYARLGLAMWLADRAKFREFEDWIFSPEKVPPLTQAVARAEQLVGAEALATALRNPWIEAQIQFDVAVYDVAYRARQGSMPQLIIGTNIAVGTFPRNELLGLMERNWGLRSGP